MDEILKCLAKILSLFIVCLAVIQMAFTSSDAYFQFFILKILILIRKSLISLCFLLQNYLLWSGTYHRVQCWFLIFSSFILAIILYFKISISIYWVQHFILLSCYHPSDGFFQYCNFSDFTPWCCVMEICSHFPRTEKIIVFFSM